MKSSDVPASASPAEIAALARAYMFSEDQVRGWLANGEVSLAFLREETRLKCRYLAAINRQREHEAETAERKHHYRRVRAEIEVNYIRFVEARRATPLVLSVLSTRGARPRPRSRQSRPVRRRLTRSTSSGDDPGGGDPEPPLADPSRRTRVGSRATTSSTKPRRIKYILEDALRDWGVQR